MQTYDIFVIDDDVDDLFLYNRLLKRNFPEYTFYLVNPRDRIYKNPNDLIACNTGILESQLVITDLNYKHSFDGSDMINALKCMYPANQILCHSGTLPVGFAQQHGIFAAVEKGAGTFKELETVLKQYFSKELEDINKKRVCF